MPELSTSLVGLVRSLRFASARVGDERFTALMRSYIVLLGDAEQHLAHNPSSQGEAGTSEVARSSADASRALDAADWKEALRQAYMTIQALPGESTWVPPFPPPPPP